MPGTVLDSGNREVIRQTMTENLHSGGRRDTVHKQEDNFKQGQVP